MRIAMLAAAIAALVACDEAKDSSIPDETGTPGTDTEDTDTDTSDTEDTQDTEDTEDTGPDVTWHRDVRPLVETHCTRCHTEGGLGNGDFTTFENASLFAPSMLVAIDAGEMPPPVADPDCRDYEGSDTLALPDGARDVIATWIDLGAPEGNPDDYVPVQQFTEQLADPDIEVFLQKPYLPDYSQGNEYRCFVLDIGHTEDVYLTAMAPIVDSREILHHAVVFKDSRDRLEGVGPEGFECMNESNTLTDMVHGWAPGALPLVLPEGKGIPLRSDEMLVVQWHYFEGNNPGVMDQSGYAFQYVDQVEEELNVYPYGPYSFDIPAGDDSYTDSLTYPIPWDGTIYAAFPHMHVLGAGYRLSVDIAKEGEVCAVQSDRYDFYNQLTYTFKEPLAFPAWSWLTMECTWNNSTSNPDLIYDPPIDVGWGERTDEEMCFAFMLVDFAI